MCSASNANAQISFGNTPGIQRPASPYNWITLIGNIELSIWIIFGCVAVVCFVIAGILFLTAMGAPEKIKQAKSAFVYGVVGIVVGIIAYSIIAIVGSLL